MGVGGAHFLELPIVRSRRDPAGGPPGLRFPNQAVDAPLAHKSVWKVTAEGQPHLPRLGDVKAQPDESTRRHLPSIATGTLQIETLFASEMSSFLPLHGARVKLALALMKTCRHLEPQKPVTPPTPLSWKNQPSPDSVSILHSLHGEGGTSPSLLSQTYLFWKVKLSN